MSYALYSQSFGLAKASSDVVITNSTTGARIPVLPTGIRQLRQA